jgi:MFS family permease
MSALLERIDRAYLALFREYPSLWRLAVITGTGQIAFALLNIYALPVYIEHILKKPGWVGLVSSTFLLCEMILKWPMGRLSDHFGRKPFIVLGPLLISLNPTIIVHLPAKLAGLIFPIRAADGAGAAALWPPLFALVGDLVKSRSRAAAMSIMNGVYVGAIGAGIILGELIARAFHNDIISFYVASAMLVISGATGYFALPKLRKKDPASVNSDGLAGPGAEEEAEDGHHIVKYSLPLVTTITFFMSMGVLMLSPFIVLYIKDTLKFTGLEMTSLMIAVAVPVMILGLPLGHAADRWGKLLAVRISLSTAALAMWLIPLCHSVVPLAAVALLLVIGHITGTPAWLAIVSELAPSSRRGRIMSLVSTAEGAGAAVGPLIGQLFWDPKAILRFLNIDGKLGPSLENFLLNPHPEHIFYFSASIPTLTALLLIFALRKPAPEH